MTSTDGTYTAFPSEGGHCEFPPRNDLEVDLLNFLKKKYQDEQTGHRISVERVVSGKGLANIYDFLRQRCPDKVNKKVVSIKQKHAKLE